jgi:hypothetical protein
MVCVVRASIRMIVRMHGGVPSMQHCYLLQPGFTRAPAARAAPGRPPRGGRPAGGPALPVDLVAVHSAQPFPFLEMPTKFVVLSMSRAYSNFHYSAPASEITNFGPVRAAPVRS